MFNRATYADSAFGRLRLFALVSVVIAAAIVLAITFGPAPAGSESPRERSAERLAATSVIKSEFAILRGVGGSAATADEIARIKAGAAALGAGQAQAERRAAPTPDTVLDSTSIRRAITDAQGTVHVAAGTDAVCLAVRARNGGGSLGCAPPELASDPSQPLLSVDYVAGTTWRVSGLLSDGSAAVRITTDTSKTAAPIQSNVFSKVVDGKPLRVQWRDGDGVMHTESFLALPTP